MDNNQEKTDKRLAELTKSNESIIEELKSLLSSREASISAESFHQLANKVNLPI
jgi:hypothetical protein